MDNLVKKERELFIQGSKIKGDNKTKTRELQLSLGRKEDYYIGMGKAFDDAFNQYARREKKQYATVKNVLMKPIVEQLYTYFTTDSITFEKCFEECIKSSKTILDNDRYGIAQKFVNMSFKYLYCYDDVSSYEHKFKECHLPLDRYTIKWVKSLKYNDINSKLKNINDAWANLNKELYDEIQEVVLEKLNEGIDYKINYNPKANNEGVYKLPINRLETEFIVWHQEKLNELHNVLSKTTLEDLERVGILDVIRKLQPLS